MASKVRVYIAAPYTKGDVAKNVRLAMRYWHELAVDGRFAPFCPHLSHFLHLHRPQPWEFWIEQDLAWLEVCDAVLRLAGESAGADKEAEHARSLGIPVFEDLHVLSCHFFKDSTDG